MKGADGIKLNKAYMDTFPALKLGVSLCFAGAPFLKY